MCPRKVMRPQFVGRESEMKMLRTMLKDVLVGEQRVVLISGEAGVGKSRLVEELLGDARVYNFLCLKSAGREEGGQIYGALIDAFQRVWTTDLIGEDAGSSRDGQVFCYGALVTVIKAYATANSPLCFAWKIFNGSMNCHWNFCSMCCAILNHVRFCYA